MNASARRLREGVGILWLVFWRPNRYNEVVMGMRAYRTCLPVALAILFGGCGGGQRDAVDAAITDGSCTVACSAPDLAPTPPCILDSDCPSPQVCNSSGACVASLVDGATCQRDQQCTSQQCLTISNAPAGDRYCSHPCNDVSDCATGLSCGVAVPAAAGQALTACVPPAPQSAAAGAVCVTDQDCASGVCQDWLCVRVCGSCAADEICRSTTLHRLGSDLSVGICTWQFPSPDLELGAAVTSVAGSQEIPFTVPAGLASFTITIVDSDLLRVSPRALVAPDQTVLFDLDLGVNINPPAAQIGISSVTVPNTDDARARPQAGTYMLRVGTYDPASVSPLVPVAGSIEQISVRFEKDGDQGGLLDVSFHFSPATGVTAATASQSTFVTDMVAQLQTLLDKSTVRLGRVSYGDLTADHDVVESADEVHSLCAGSSDPGPHASAVNLFLVQSIPFFSAAGISGGIPGPPGFFSTDGSGIVATVLDSGSHTGTLVAHEIGHFLGLHHTTELTVPVFDPISDTPVCPSGTYIQNCPDYQNLMFPDFWLQGGLTLSPDQIAVLRGAPLLYQVDRPAACPQAASTIDVTEGGFATGDSKNLSANFTGSCGGGGSPERVQLYRLTHDGLSSLNISVTGLDFAPAVYLRRDHCADDAVELGCQIADAGSVLSLSLDHPTAGSYFIVVDGQSGGGTYQLTVTEVP